MTTRYYLKVLDVKENKVTVVIQHALDIENRNQDITKEFFLAVFRDATESFQEYTAVEIDDKLNVLQIEISEGNFYSLLGMERPKGSFNVNQFVASVTH